MFLKLTLKWTITIDEINKLIEKKSIENIYLIIFPN